MAPLYVLFFFSGFPALLYQIVWQRALFAIYGVNIESVTVVVSAFMLGLGLGSLAGGRLSESRRVPLLLAFGAIELGIAAFGVASLPLFHWVAEFTAGSPPLQTGFIAFGLVIVPTTLMGATLPLLVAHLVKRSGNVGRSVGILYFVNTLGSASACFAAAQYTMPRLGMSGSVWLAASMNALIGSTVLALHFVRRGRTAAASETHDTGGVGLLPFPAAMLLAASAGFISLGYEIVWYRAYSFVSEGSAKGFSFVLGAFLAGIAFGSLFSRPLCGKPAEQTPARIAVVVLLANLLGFATVPLLAAAVGHLGYVWTLPLVAVSAAMLGAVFPLICHVAVRPDGRAGAGMSYLYLSNILGSALGSLLVGFILMDIWPLRAIVTFLTVIGIAVSAALLPRRVPALVVATLLSAGVVVSSRPIFNEVWEKLQWKAEYRPGQRFTDVVETRSGVITVDAAGTVFGNGHFDGTLATDLSVSDAPIRAYTVSLFHPAPRDVLIIGMASGAWAEVVANHPQLEKLTVIEINPGYITVMQRHPSVSPVLFNPKAQLCIDDARRWLTRNPARRFDMIFMDTTAHWRAHMTNLLSREFLMMARRHLKPGGVLYYNTTESAEAQATALSVFPGAFRCGRFIAASDRPIEIDRERWRSILLQYRLEGKRVFDLSRPDDQASLDQALALAHPVEWPEYDAWTGIERRESIARRVAGHRVITDDNMASEWSR